MNFYTSRRHTFHEALYQRDAWSMKAWSITVHNPHVHVFPTNKQKLYPNYHYYQKRQVAICLTSIFSQICWNQKLIMKMPAQNNNNVECLLATRCIDWPTRSATDLHLSCRCSSRKIISENIFTLLEMHVVCKGRQLLSNIRLFL